MSGNILKYLKMLLFPQPAFTCPKSTLETLKHCMSSVQCSRPSVFIVNFEQIWHIVPVFPLLILNN